MKIEKNIPMPKKDGGSRGPKAAYDWGALNVGDSFTIDGTKRSGLFTSLRNYNKRSQTTIKIKTEIEGKNKYRCWRVE